MDSPEHMIIGLTGGIGSGKSSAAQLFAELGVRIIDTDAIGHELSTPPSIALDDIATQFGSDFLAEDGTLNRSRMREYVFSHPQARKKLEAIFHPRIFEQAKQRLKAPTTAPYSILMVPLLFETTAFTALVQRSVVVDCAEELQIARVMARNKLSREEVIAIISTQRTRQERLMLADDIISNDGSFERLRDQVCQLHQRYLLLSNSVQ